MCWIWASASGLGAGHARMAVQSSGVPWVGLASAWEGDSATLATGSAMEFA